VAETVVSIDIGADWDPNAPFAVLLSDDQGRTALALNAHSDDPDQRSVVLFWTGCRYRAMGDPNDEARSGHRLWRNGLASVLWVGAVRESELVTALERQNSVHDRHDPARFAGLVHHVVLMKEETVEVVAESLTVKRIDGPTGPAARGAFAI
jgi:hypothetical protein